MEELKPLEQLGEPDERHQFFVVRDTPSSPYRKIAAADFHQMAEHASLHADVPEEVRSHFAMAQNLLAHSWYCYPFNVAAQLHAYISVEFALRTRLKAPDSAQFKKLLKEAMDLGLIRSDGFTYGREPEQQPYPPNTTVPGAPVEIRDYATDVADAMRSLRNDLAHGTNMLNMKGGTVLLVCSELINQLFVVPQA
ncbi:hypothetical protein J2X20_005826 [Pelomonas saccharophila]|uniref:RiboL-PSP-HEPN domain-containing protein n=1 Tax=Roseateles saccharophilus TaxID=304 RepID=A0ABU1YY34_ROSSA|nr:hypothetical protein [Roseateles saccharophilus]MDR7273141.1 hypothetical protein [Roseateles saccharophilus]